MGKIKQKNVDYLVIGAGITGLAFAKRIAKTTSNYLVIEKNNRVGGLCKSFYQDGFIWDYGGHFLHFQNPTVKSELNTFLKSDRVALVDKNTKIFYKNDYISFPFQYNINELEKEEYSFCLKGLLEANNKKGNNFKEFVLNRYGKGICDAFLIPYNEKLYATKLENLDVNAMGRFFPIQNIKTERDLLNKKMSSYNDSFYFCKNGVEDFIQFYGKNIKNIQLNTEVKNVNYKDKICQLNNGTTIKYVHLINTIPFLDFLKLINLKPKCLFSYNKVIVFNFGFKNKSLNNYSWIYFPQKDLSFYRVGFYNNIGKTEKMSIYVEVGMKSNAKNRINFLKKQVIEELKKIKIIANDPCSWNYKVIEPAYVHLSSKSIKEKNRIENIIKQFDCYSIGRYGGWKYCSVEDCIIDGTELAEKLLNE